MQMTVLEKIRDFIFGHKYYVNIINRRGTDIDEVSSFIFWDKKAANKHKVEIANTSSFIWIETVSFRSRCGYKCKYKDND